jgi:uncharacterized protein (TIGR02270 family)
MQQARRIPWDIYEEHLDEAAFLRSQWERSFHSANHTLADVADGPEARLLAHLDALVLGGRAVAERLLVPALLGDDTDRVFVAAWALLHGEDADWFESVWEALVAAPQPAQRDALGRAFTLGTRAELPARLAARLGRHSVHRGGGPLDVVHPDAVIVDVLAARDASRLARLPLRELGAAAVEGSSDGSRALLGAVLRALPRVPATSQGMVALHGFIEAQFGSAHPDVRAAAIEAGALLRLASTRSACRQAIAERTPLVRLAMTALAVLGDRGDHERLRHWLETPDLQRAALWALGASGRIDAIEVLVQSLDDAALAPLAADSMSHIVGLGIEGPYAVAGAPASLDDGLGDDDPPPDLSPDDDLPTPHVAQVRAWWRANAQRFNPELRYVRGLPWTTTTWVAALTRSATWRHPGLRLALDAPLAATLDLRTWASQQRAWAPPRAGAATIEAAATPSL